MPAPYETCRLCRAQSTFAFSGLALNHQVRYFDCAACGFFQTESPHWLGEAYATAINDADTGIMWRNLQNVPRVIGTLLAFGKLKGRVLDQAGGYGILVRLLRDSGIDARWQDKYCQNLVARGFEAGEEGCDLVTAFEVFEHFVDPLAELHAMLDRAPLVLLSTELIRAETPLAPNWWYLGSKHGQHIVFFRKRTLWWMAHRLGVHCATDGRQVHLFSSGKIPWYWRRLLRYPSLMQYLADRQLRSLRNADHALLTGVQIK